MGYDRLGIGRPAGVDDVGVPTGPDRRWNDSVPGPGVVDAKRSRSRRRGRVVEVPAVGLDYVRLVEGSGLDVRRRDTGRGRATRSAGRAPAVGGRHRCLWNPTCRVRRDVVGPYERPFRSSGPAVGETVPRPHVRPESRGVGERTETVPERRVRDVLASGGVPSIADRRPRIARPAGQCGHTVSRTGVTNRTKHHAESEDRYGQHRYDNRRPSAVPRHVRGWCRGQLLAGGDSNAGLSHGHADPVSWGPGSYIPAGT
jgi:hypothetical protein